jgi:hypothetical protein
MGYPYYCLFVFPSGSSSVSPSIQNRLVINAGVLRVCTGVVIYFCLDGALLAFASDAGKDVRMMILLIMSSKLPRND